MFKGTFHYNKCRCTTMNWNYPSRTVSIVSHGDFTGASLSENVEISRYSHLRKSQKYNILNAISRSLLPIRF